MPHYLIRHTLNDGYAEFVGATDDFTWVVTPDLPTVADALAWAEDQDTTPDPYADRISQVVEVGAGLGGTPDLWAYLKSGHDPKYLVWDSESGRYGWVVVGDDGVPVAPLPIYVEHGPAVLDYVARVEAASWRAVAPWMSTRCDECGLVPGDDGHHVVHPDGYVIVGCEGYWQVNPNAVGLDHPRWQDWTEDC
jgi:hypothetical protein